jgi:hypothetical protein
MLRLSVAGVVFALSCLSVGTATAATRAPNPPKQICIGSNCVTTTTSPAGAKIKWHPGHYGASGGIAYPDSALSKFQPEMDDMMKDDWIVGYRLFVTWAALDAGPVTFTASVGNATKGTLTKPVDSRTYWASFDNGEYRQVTVSDTTAVTWTNPLPAGSVTTGHLYTTDLLDQVLARMKTHYAKPKQLVIAILAMSFSKGTRNPSDFSRIPEYITTGSVYGPSPDGRSHGWWGPPPGTTVGAYSAALYRPAVAAQYAALGQALGAKYDADPNFEAIMDQENSAVVGPAINFPPIDSSYSDEAYTAQQKSFLTAWLAAFPHTNVVSENTFMRGATATQQFAAWMIANRVAPGTADVSGQSYYDLPGGRLMSNWGLAAYAGQTVPGSSYKGVDYRGTVRPMVDIEGPDIGTSVGAKVSAMPLDLVKGLNQTLKASHAFWCHIPDGRGPAPAPKWADVTAVLKANPLTNTGYPGNYP